MPRQQRYRLPGVPQHVIQCGNNRQVTFFYNLEKAWEQGNPAAVAGLVLNYRELPSSSVAAPGHASANPNPGNKISIQSGNNQRTAILSPVPAPLVVTVTDEGGNAVQGAAVTYKVTQGAGLFDNSTQNIDVLTDSDGRASVNFTVGREEGRDNHRVTANLTGTNATAGFTASALMPGDPGNTVITGVVMDNQDTPLPNVTIRIEGTNRQAVSDGKGIFTITEVPVGPVRLLVEGQTTTITGDWPTLSYDLVTVAGATNTLPAPIYLVPLNTKSAKIVGSEDVTLTLDEVPGFALTVKKGSVTFPDGAKTGKMSVTVVNSSKVPMPPPNGMQPQFIVTIQPTGARFDPPAQLQLPNVDGHKPGAEVEMYSYDHDLEEFVTIGWGTVSEDGKVIKSNEGVGVIKAGWHCGSQPTTTGCTADCGDCRSCKDSKTCKCEKDDTKKPKQEGWDCCSGKSFDTNSLCCIENFPFSGQSDSLQRVLVSKDPIPNFVPMESCPNRSQNNKAHEYDGCTGVPDDPLRQLAGIHLPNSSFGTSRPEDQHLPCNWHDTCYQSCGVSKETCDLTFIVKGDQLCDSLEFQGGSLVDPNSTIPKIRTPEEERAVCKEIVRYYYFGLSSLVDFISTPAWKSQQHSYCKCC